ncbi:hypothetical protein ILUMI_17860 [Ignelater luminosus]|uniref:DDE-1 domain-containing protein n=1 Tax=Ignelater luminosus TaxID=2038154 RepID=A0A8K0G7H8_IGNLU|nr:hypothetical protein ILUMI_17860 [Ignelater luminosus]
MNNHDSHLSIEALNFAKENGIILLILPPQCSHKLQPLDVAVFRSFKKFYNAACDTIHSIAGLVGDALPKSFILLNICNGFKKTACFTKSTSLNLHQELSPSRIPLVVDAVVSPDEIRTHSKAPSRKGARNIKKERSAILTDTPTKKALEKEAAKRNDKKMRKQLLKKEI